MDEISVVKYGFYIKNYPYTQMYKYLEFFFTKLWTSKYQIPVPCDVSHCNGSTGEKKWSMNIKFSEM